MSSSSHTTPTFHIFFLMSIRIILFRIIPRWRMGLKTKPGLLFVTLRHLLLWPQLESQDFSPNTQEKEVQIWSHWLPFLLLFYPHSWPWFTFYHRNGKAWLHYLVLLLCSELSSNSHQFIVIVYSSLCPPLCPSIRGKLRFTYLLSYHLKLDQSLAFSKWPLINSWVNEHGTK